MKKLLVLVLAATMITAAFSGCSGTDGFDSASEIAVVTRENGSSTR